MSDDESTKQPVLEYEVIYEQGSKTYGRIDCTDKADALRQFQEARDCGAIPGMLRADYWMTLYDKTSGVPLWEGPPG